MKSKSADITCDRTLVETDKVMKVSEFLGKSRIKKYLYALFRISDEKKLKIIFPLIAQESLYACDIVYTLSCSTATASHHSRILYDADILDCQKKGKTVYYSVEDDDPKKIPAQLDR